MELNTDILKDIFPTFDIMEHDSGGIYVRSWNICCWGDNPGSIYLYEMNLKNLDTLTGRSYVAGVIDEFIDVSESVVYKIANSRRWGLKSLTLVNINSLDELSRILTDSIYADDICNVIGVTESRSLASDVMDKYSEFSLSSIIYDLKTNSMWDVVTMSLYQRQLESTPPSFLPSYSSLDAILIKNFTNLYMKYSINLTSSHEIRDGIIDTDKFNIKMTPGIDSHRYRILSRDTFMVNSADEINELVGSIYNYYELLLPFL